MEESQDEHLYFYQPITTIATIREPRCNEPSAKPFVNEISFEDTQKNMQIRHWLCLRFDNNIQLKVEKIIELLG